MSLDDDLQEQGKNRSGSQRRGKWQAGESGNPQGRPPGTGNVAQLRAAIAARLPTILEAVIAQAEAGDVQACRLLLDRVLPALKPVEQHVAIPAFAESGRLVGQGDAVLLALAEGRVAASQASVLLSGLATLAKLKESEDFERRLEALESAQAALTNR